MLKKITTSAVTVCLLLLAVAAATPQEKKARGTKDQKEYDLAVATNKSAQGGDYAAALKSLKEWEAYHPESDYKDDWPATYMQLYVQLQDHENTIEAAKKLIEKNPDDFTAHYYTMRAVNQLGDKAPKGLAVSAASKTLELVPKQANLDDKQKQALEIECRETLAKAYTAAEQHNKAEKQYRQLVKLKPELAAYSYSLGESLRQQSLKAFQADDQDKVEQLYPPALFSFARALAIEGDGALPADNRTQIEEFVKKRFTEFTGDTADLESVMELAKTNPLPPAGFTVKSSKHRAEDEAKKEAEFRAANPFLSQYLNIKTSLLTDEGTWPKLHTLLTPEMALYVVGMDSNRPQVLSLSSKPGGSTEVVLNLSNRLRAAPARGKKIKFEGVASNFTKEPFKLTLTSGKVL